MFQRAFKLLNGDDVQKLSPGFRQKILRHGLPGLSTIDHVSERPGDRLAGEATSNARKLYAALQKVL